MAQQHITEATANLNPLQRAMIGATKVVEDSANQLYRVAELTDPNLAHCFIGVRVKRAKGGVFVPVAGNQGTKPRLVRKIGCRVVVL
jgi:hypothetical protein